VSIDASATAKRKETPSYSITKFQPYIRSSGFSDKESLSTTGFARRIPTPARSTDAVVTEATSEEQAILYFQSGYWNAMHMHIDPKASG
jgi:hypothetical protein